jgi:hypothetical protein
MTGLCLYSDGLSPVSGSHLIGIDVGSQSVKGVLCGPGGKPIGTAQVDDAARLLEDPAVLRTALDASGAPVRMAELDPPVDADTTRWALANCHLIRARPGAPDIAAQVKAVLSACAS